MLATTDTPHTGEGRMEEPDKALKIAWWIIFDDCECDLDAALVVLPDAIKADHRGDCTKEAFTCVRCLADQAEEMARRIRREELA